MVLKETIFFRNMFKVTALINFHLNDMNMFERTRAFVPDHFFRHYTDNYYFLLINAKNAKTVP